MDYGKRYGVPFVIVRPGSVFGPGKAAITGRVGVGTFGIFPAPGRIGPDTVHLHRQLRRCDRPGWVEEGCRRRGVQCRGRQSPLEPAVSAHVSPACRTVSFDLRTPWPELPLCWLWEKYSDWSEGQLPPVFNRARWHAEWKRTRYSNEKLKTRLGWTPRVPMSEGMERYLQGCLESRHA